MLEILFENEDLLSVAEQAFLPLIEQVLQTAFARVEYPKGSYELSLSFVDDETIRTINNEYRQKDASTDVISFAFNDTDDGIQYTEDMPRLLGEIYIALPTARRQAQEYNHSFKRELIFLALHGILHVLGYDHMTESDEQIMFALQDEILAEHNI